MRAGLLAAGHRARDPGRRRCRTECFRLASPLIQRIEGRAAQRTAELSEANRSLKKEVTERQQTEAALRRMSKVFMEATVPMSIQDLSGRIIDINPEVERTYGWSRDELLGQPIDKIVPPERLQQQHELAARCMRGEKVRNVEGWRQAKSGEVVPVLLTLSLLTDEEGGSARDRHHRQGSHRAEAPGGAVAGCGWRSDDGRGAGTEEAGR